MSGEHLFKCFAQLRNGLFALFLMALWMFFTYSAQEASVGYLSITVCRCGSVHPARHSGSRGCEFKSLVGRRDYLKIKIKLYRCMGWILSPCLWLTFSLSKWHLDEPTFLNLMESSLSWRAPFVSYRRNLPVTMS